MCNRDGANVEGKIMDDGNLPADNTATQAATPPAKVEMTQAELNELIASSKRTSYEKGQREAQEAAAKANPNLSEDKIKELIANSQKEQVLHDRANQTVNQFMTKINAGKERYPDIEQKLVELDLQETPEIIELANALDNTADVMYELAKHPGKAAAVVAALRTGQGKNARLQMQKLSSSIKDNQKATIAVPKEPLSQIKPSNAAGDDGVVTLESLKKASYLRR